MHIYGENGPIAAESHFVVGLSRAEIAVVVLALENLRE